MYSVTLEDIFRSLVGLVDKSPMMSGSVLLCAR